MSTIKYIESMLETYTPIGYAKKLTNNRLLDKEELYDVYASSSEDSLKVVLDRCFTSYLKQYEDNLKAYRGFIENGRVFIIDKRDKVVYFLSENKKNENVSVMIPEYNPLGVDVIEKTVMTSYIFNRQDINMYDFSLNRENIVKELDEFIQQTKNLNTCQ